jgi:hypothetical protein
LSETNDGIEFPESVAVAPNGNLLAISHSWAEHNFGISLFPIDEHSPKPIEAKRENVRFGVEAGRAFHGVAFSPDSRFLAFTNLDEPGYVEVVDITARPHRTTCLLANDRFPLTPKSISFSRDGYFAAIAMAYPGTPDNRSIESAGILTIHRFDAARGMLDPEPFAEYLGQGMELSTSDFCTFLPRERDDPYRIAVVDQAADEVRAFEFAPNLKSLRRIGTFASDLTFPHDVDISTDGKFVAISNYGNDSLTIGRMI